MSIKENHLLGKFRERLILYGWCVTLLILIKTVLRKLFGFSWEKYYLMARDLNNLPELPEEKFTVKELSIHDYENRLWEPSFLDANKKQLYLERFANPKAKAYGVFVNGELAFSSWVQYEEIIIQSRFRFPKKRSALLLDSYCYPRFRRLGLHNYMVIWRLYEMKKHGIEKCYVAIWAYNRPSIRAQIKCGLQTIGKFHIINFGNKKWCTLKNIPQ